MKLRAHVYTRYRTADSYSCGFLFNFGVFCLFFDWFGLGWVFLVGWFFVCLVAVFFACF